MITTSDTVAPGPHGDVPVRVYGPAGPDATGPQLVWVHGGAFSGGGLDQLESHAVATALAEVGLTVVTVDYRRVPAWNPLRRPAPGVLPGIRFPVPLDDVEAAFRWAAEQAATTPALGGASAGACLSAAAALRLANQGLRGPSRLALAYGTFHARLPRADAELRSRLRGRYSLGQFTPQVVECMNRNYAGAPSAMADPYAFPGGHDLRPLPPTLILDADRDALAASGGRFARELAAQGVRYRRTVVPETRHGFLDKPGRPAFELGITALADWLFTA